MDLVLYPHNLRTEVTYLPSWCHCVMSLLLSIQNYNIISSLSTNIILISFFSLLLLLLSNGSNRVSLVAQLQRICLQCRSHRKLRFYPWVGKIPWRKSWQPTPVFLPGESCGQRSLADYGPYGRKSQTQLNQLSMYPCNASNRSLLEWQFLGWYFIILDDLSANLTN